MVKQQALGFTLIELMIVVAILGILAAIAYPSYTGYIERGNRADMMAEMHQIGERVEANKITYKRYDRIPLNEIFNNTVTNNGTSFPSSDLVLYNVSITPISGSNLGGRNWKIIAIPETAGRMKGDGSLTLDYLGEKCRGTECGMSEEWR